jgi:hypothetical protein
MANGGLRRKHVSGIAVLVLATTAGLVAAAPVADAAKRPVPKQNQVKQSIAALQSTIASSTKVAATYPYASQGTTGPENFVKQLAIEDLGIELLAADPNNPQLYRYPDPFTRPGEDPGENAGNANPDNVYYIAKIQPGAHYKITGVRGNSEDLIYQVLDTIPGTGSLGNVTNQLSYGQVKINPDGTYAVNISPGAGALNQLTTVPTTTVLLIRQTFNNWGTAIPDQLKLTRIDQTAAPKRSLSDADLARAVDATSTELATQTKYWSTFWAGVMNALPVNVLPAPINNTGGVQGQTIDNMHYKLGPGQALVITMPRANAVYQGLEVTDAWTQTLPYVTRQSSLNATQAVLGSDGAYHLVLSAQDPGVPNWLDSVGSPEGLILMRWQRLPANLPANQYPTAQVVPLSEVRSVLPADTPVVTKAQRKLSLSFRIQSAARLEAVSNNGPGTKALSDAISELQGAVGAKALNSVLPSTANWVKRPGR